jgi:integrase
MTIQEATVGAIDRYLKTLARTHPSGAQRCKGTLLQMFSMAVRHGALPANPVRDVGRLPRPRKIVQAMTFDEIERVRLALHLWRTTKAVGPRKSRACTDLFDLLLATGCRIGEACALRWQDIDLHAGTLTVAGTMVFLRGTGWERQEFPKTLAGQRTIHLPPFARAMLSRRRTEEPHDQDDPLFASRTGTFVQPDNMRRSLRSALQRQADLKWVSPHVFRKTVATVLSGKPPPSSGTSTRASPRSSTSRSPRPLPTSAMPWKSWSAEASADEMASGWIAGHRPCENRAVPASSARAHGTEKASRGTLRRALSAA